MESPNSENNRAPAPSLCVATSIQGIGTTFFGQRDFRPDGTFLTTEFSILFNLPVLPIRTLRVRYLGKGRHPAEPGLRPGPLYEILKETNPNWIQVVYVYSYVAFVIWWLLFFVTHCDNLTKNMEEKLGDFAIIIGFIWPFFIAATMRFLRKRFNTLRM